MKVAIIGAGTAGLACAIELERNGIYPTIFERNDFIGEYHPHVSAFINLIARPIPDPLKYIQKYFGIKLNPINGLKKVIHYSPNNQVEVKGQLGYLMIRGREENSVKNQLRKMVKSQINFNTYVEPDDIEKDFDYIVLADGHWKIPERYGIWEESLQAWLKGGIFEGDFDENAIEMWLDNDLTNGVYIYSAPYSKNKGVIAHIVQGIEQEELNNYWQRFLESRNILKKYNLLETWELSHHTGLVKTNRVGKVYFIGAAGGGAEPFLGFGQSNAIYGGVMAARSIAHGYDINILLKDITKKAKQLASIRPLLTSATNKDFDMLLTLMKSPGFRSLAYKTNLDVIKLISMGAKLLLPKNELPGKRGI